MDLPLYARVFWRFRLLMAAGLLLATSLAFLSLVRVDLDGSQHFSYRQQEQWASRAMLLITEPKFPEGRSVFEQLIPPASTDKAQDYAPAFASPDRFVALANLYAQLATSDPVRQIMLRDGPLRGVVEAAPVSTVNGAASLPLLSIGGIAPTPEQARRLATRSVAAFLSYLEGEQRRSKIPSDQRVVLQVIKQPVKVQLLKGQPKTLPIVVFLTILLGAGGVAFVLENLRPRAQHLPIEGKRLAEDLRDRRSA